MGSLALGGREGGAQNEGSYGTHPEARWRWAVEAEAEAEGVMKGGRGEGSHRISRVAVHLTASEHCPRAARRDKEAAGLMRVEGTAGHVMGGEGRRRNQR